MESLVWEIGLALQSGSYTSGSFSPTLAPVTFELQCYKFASFIIWFKSDILPLKQWMTHI